MLRLVGNRLACSSQTSTFVAPGAVAASSAAVSQSRSIHFLYVSNAVTRQKKPMSAEIVEFEGTPASSRKIRIYTRTGDKGTTSLYTGERRAKDDAVFEALGTVDELTSTLGLALEHCDAAVVPGISDPLSDLRAKLEQIQSRLQDVNSHIATPRDSKNLTPERLAKTEFDTDGKLALELEAWIDKYDEELPTLKQFILPSGGLLASTVHIARTICRRAERRVVPLVESGVAHPSAGRYLNRLSDFLFTAARYASHRQGKKDRIYIKRGEEA